MILIQHIFLIHFRGQVLYFLVLRVGVCDICHVSEDIGQSPALLTHVLDFSYIVSFQNQSLQLESTFLPPVKIRTG